MSIKRISDFDISNRPMFSAIYGPGCTDVFIDSDLYECNLHEALYRYFKSEGYMVVFYTDDSFRNLFSYGTEDMDTHDDPKHEKNNNASTGISSSSADDYWSDYDNDSSSLQNDDNKFYKEVVFDDGRSIFRTRRLPDGLDTIIENFDLCPRTKIVYVFTAADIDRLCESDQIAQIVSKLNTLRIDYYAKKYQFKIVGIYNTESIRNLYNDPSSIKSEMFFLDKFFKGMVVPNETENSSNNNDDVQRCVYYLGQPFIDEIGYFLNKRRLLDNVQNVMQPSFETLRRRLCQKVREGEKKGEGPVVYLKLHDLNEWPLDKLQDTIDDINNNKTMDKFNRLQGIDNIKEQFEKYRSAFKKYIDDKKNGKNPIRFRPHMALMGNPGTGKTTVAKLFGKILSEDGLLSIGHFIKVTVGDLIGEYVGSTRPKTAAVCEKAKGGVLFIDEAYGLMSDSKHNGANYGEEAIEVLIQFMEENDDSLVILAGYEEKIMKLINKGNDGFKSRFHASLGFYRFNDYNPDVLYSIADRSIPEEIERTEDFNKALKNLVAMKYAYKAKNFGNAREMENMADAIVKYYKDTEHRNRPLDVRHLPEQMRRCIDPNMLSLEMINAKLERFIGQDKVKKIIIDLFDRVKAERTRIFNNIPVVVEQHRMNYVFSGNPGTGKTSFARVMGEMLSDLGILQPSDEDMLIEKTGNDLMRMTPEEIKSELYDNAIGKVLFIDEAYQMTQENLAEIVGNATNPDYESKMCVILAGYSDDMERLLAVNAGSMRRFEVIEFEDYTNEQLFDILIRYASNPKNQIIVDGDECRDIAIDYFSRIERNRSFGNAGIVTGPLVEALKKNRDIRYNNATDAQKLDREFAFKVIPQDFPNYDEYVQQHNNNN